MPKESAPANDETVLLLKQLVAIELWRGGLSQSQIRTRLGLNMNVVNRMLKGVRRQLEVRVKPTD